MTKDDIALAITPFIRTVVAAGCGFLGTMGLTGATDLIPSFTAALVLLLATLAWSLAEKNKLVATAVDQMPVSSLESVAAMVAKLRSEGGDPLLIAHIAQAVTALANQELAAAQPALVPVPAPSPQPAAAPVDPPSPPTVVAPTVEAAPIVQPDPQPVAPVLADGSLPS